jgi:hypothetical protein
MHHGTWRSLAAHLLWEQGVAGSNPAVPTTQEKPQLRPSVGSPSVGDFEQVGRCQPLTHTLTVREHARHAAVPHPLPP